MSLLEIILEELMNYGHIVDEEMSEKSKITAVLYGMKPSLRTYFKLGKLAVNREFFRFD
jgi:hypothetical protein